MSSQRRSWWPVWVGAVLLLVLSALLLLRAKAPPEAARLLPESDAILYANLRPLRALAGPESDAESGQAPRRSPSYQAFVDATGIQPGRDLDSVAIALHRMSNPHGANGPVAYSEVFVGHFDAVRLKRYLKSIAVNTETYSNREIYNIPVQSRTLHVAVLGYDTIAASNTPGFEQIHSILDRSRAPALWRPGSSLLAARFGEVPLLSQAWGIGHIGLPFGDSGSLHIMGLSLPIPVDTELIASLRYSGSVHLRIEEIAPSVSAAEHTAESVDNILSLFRGLASASEPQNARDAAFRSVLNSIKITQQNDRDILSASATLRQAQDLTGGDGSTPGLTGPEIVGPKPSRSSSPAAPWSAR